MTDTNGAAERVMAAHLTTPEGRAAVDRAERERRAIRLGERLRPIHPVWRLIRRGLRQTLRGKDRA